MAQDLAKMGKGWWPGALNNDTAALSPSAPRAALAAPHSGSLPSRLAAACPRGRPPPFSRSPPGRAAPCPPPFPPSSSLPFPPPPPSVAVPAPPRGCRPRRREVPMARRRRSRRAGRQHERRGAAPGRRQRQGRGRRQPAEKAAQEGSGRLSLPLVPPGGVCGGGSSERRGFWGRAAGEGGEVPGSSGSGGVRGARWGHLLLAALCWKWALRESSFSSRLPWKRAVVLHNPEIYCFMSPPPPPVSNRSGYNASYRAACR